METRPLGRSDLRVSAIGLGCVTLGREIDRDTSFAVLDRAREHGITLFDTAEAYSQGTSESILGEWITARRNRDQIVLATKVSGTLTRQRITDSAAASLVRLQTDRIDLFQLHSWDDETPLEETLSALESLVRAGKVRAIGVSNWSALQLCRALLSAAVRAGIRIESIQPPYNLVQREIEPELLPLCVEHQIGITSYSPLGAGFLTGKYTSPTDVPKGTRFDVIPGHQPIYFTDAGFRVVNALRALSAESGRTMMDLALAWVLSRPGVTSMLIGARSPAQVDQAVRAHSTPLPPDLLQQLNML
ncbi:MAG: aldo/keto reductase [Planctomycetaceae bacterium]|nr:aldo/keto reductase [Planctomycetaceae bacterium]